MPLILFRISGQEVDWNEYLKYKHTQSIQVEAAPSANGPSDVSGDSEAVLQPLESQKPSDKAPSILNGAPAPMSFAELADLIMNHQTHLIPNNEAIPSILSVC